mmetsp:Transcript_22316/g.21562  ORF Transcript_22316/g.21562 Transcript_22316/m.21562 type:complete len:128 (-) Transcript_22316:10-393(-)
MLLTLLFLAEPALLRPPPSGIVLCLEEPLPIFVNQFIRNEPPQWFLKNILISSTMITLFTIFLLPCLQLPILTVPYDTDVSIRLTAYICLLYTNNSEGYAQQLNANSSNQLKKYYNRLDLLERCGMV